MVPDHAGADRDHRQSIPVGRIAQVEDAVDAAGDLRRRQGHEQGDSHRREREEPAVPQNQQQTGAGAGADPCTARQRDDECGGERRKCGDRPGAVACLEQEAGQAGADEQHQHARVGHVVPQRAARSPAEMVVVEEAVLDDADRRGRHAGGQGRADDRPGALAVGETVDDRHDQKQQDLSGFDEAGHGREGERHAREERPGGVRRQRREERRGPGADGVRRAGRDPEADQHCEEDLRDRYGERQGEDEEQQDRPAGGVPQRGRGRRRAGRGHRRCASRPPRQVSLIASSRSITGMSSLIGKTRRHLPHRSPAP